MKLMKLSRYIRDAAVFAPCYLVLDWVSYIHPLGLFNITPWNPQPALAIAWMVLAGLVHAPAVLLIVFVADVVIRNAPAGYAVTFLSAVVLTAGYTAVAWALRLLLQPKPGLHTVRQLTIFILVVVPGSAIVAAAFVGLLYGAGFLPSDSVLPGWLRFSVGDAVGILVTAPLLLVAADAESRRRLRSLVHRSETYLQVALVAVTLWLIFEGLRGDPSHHFYLMFPPVIWIAVRSGMAGAIVAVALVQVGVVLGIHHRSLQALPIIELQSLVAALTLTGLYLGVMVDERERASEGLRQTLRLAAAGEMVGAIAHELNQPLTALMNYGRSGEMLVAAGRSAELAAVMGRMLKEAQRASEVVRRLRDFFRSGTTRLEQVQVLDLLEGARRAGESLPDGRGISFNIEVEESLPDILVDRLQIELVLRNVVTNAIEAVKAHSAADARITMSAARHDVNHVRITVADSGPGVGPAAAERVFEPFVSGKSTGMGLGLAVSRAIAQAHGGTLDASDRPHGEFQLVLPFGAVGE